MKNRFITLAAVAALISLPALSAQEEGKAKGKGPMAMMDKDGDGFVSKEEFLATGQAKKNPDGAAERFAKMDKDGDGKLSADELKAGAQKGKKGEGKKGEGKKEKHGDE